MPHVVYDPKQHETPPGASSDWQPPPELRVLAEGIRFTFLPYKAVQITEEQHRFMMQKGAGAAGLSLLSVDDDLVSEILEKRAAGLKPEEAAPAPVPARVPPPEAEAHALEPAAPIVPLSLVAQATAIHNFPKLAAFARAALGTKEIPRTREAILTSLAAEDARLALPAKDAAP